MATKPDFDETLDLETLIFLAEKPNIGEFFTDERLSEIGRQCLVGYEADCQSRAAWLEELKEIRKFAGDDEEGNQQSKTYPWPDASNVQYPLILSSALQFNARAYPAIVNMGNPVLAKVIGDDPDGEKQKRADRISRHMSWQLNEEMEEWDEDMDRLLLTLPLDGCAFKKVYYDVGLGRNVSELVLADDFIVANTTMTLATCPRASQRFALFPHEIIERINDETFLDADYDLPEDEGNFDPIEFIEQHTWLDTDGDGYPEPYIVTFTEKGGEVARIRANFGANDIKTDDQDLVIKITPKKYFVKYECFPDPSGGFYGRGFGSLLKPLNDSVNSILNMLIDAGHLANAGGGFIASNFQLDSGSIKFSPGKWEKVDTGGFPIGDAFEPLPINEPSNVLFQLLGLMIDAAKEIGSTQDVMTGGAPGSNTPATTTLAIIEQGMKVYTAIFKRIYRSMQIELDMIYSLNSVYVSDGNYQTVLDTPEAISQQDYNTEDMNVVPAADPASATDIQKAAKTQILMQFYGQPTANSAAIQLEALKAAGISEPEKYMAPPQEGPSPEEMQVMAELQLKEKDLAIKKMKAAVDALDTIASAMKKMAETDELGADNTLNMSELLLLANSVRGLIANDNTLQEPGRSPAMEGQQPMAMGVPGP